MSAAVDNDLVQMTLQSLDASQEGLQMLRNDCLRGAELLATDLGQGVSLVSQAAERIHDFICFEQNVIGLFGIDPAAIVLRKDSLSLAAEDMHEILNAFVAKLDATDLVGIVGLLRDQVVPVLERFRKLLPVLRDQVYEFISGEVDV